MSKKKKRLEYLNRIHEQERLQQDEELRKAEQARKQAELQKTETDLSETSLAPEAEQDHEKYILYFILGMLLFFVFTPGDVINSLSMFIRNFLFIK